LRRFAPGISLINSIKERVLRNFVAVLLSLLFLVDFIFAAPIQRITPYQDGVVFVAFGLIKIHFKNPKNTSFSVDF